MTSLDNVGIKYGTDKCSLGHNYLHFYEQLLKPFNGKFKMLELGVQFGFSLKMWEESYPNAKIIGVDNDPEILNRNLNLTNAEFLYGDVTDETFVDKLINKEDEFDIIIDDASHKSQDQINSFMFLFPYIKPGGYYIIEDLHTSYQETYTPLDQISCIDYLKHLVDVINDQKYNNEFEKFIVSEIDSIIFIRSLAVIKRIINKNYLTKA